LEQQAVEGIMKNLITIINLSIIIAITTIFTRSDQGNHKASSEADITEVSSISEKDGNSDVANDNNMQSNFDLPSFTEGESVADDFVSDFLKEMAEARMMDLQEGKTAEQRATYKSLKQYGSLMVEDQSKMLKEIRALAEEKKVFIPSSLGAEKADALADLERVHGESFDKKFIRMMILDHKRDVKKLERATEYGDADVQVFATKYLPVVQSHLDKIKALKNGN
jgi:putative membrane protein